MKYYQKKTQSLLLLSIVAASVTLSVYSCKNSDDKLPGGDVEEAEPFNEFEDPEGKTYKKRTEKIPDEPLQRMD